MGLVLVRPVQTTSRTVSTSGRLLFETYEFLLVALSVLLTSF
jgi:hypothetical protein